MGRHLSTQQFDQVLQRLSLEYDIYAPKRFEKQGRFSDTDVIRYDTIETLDEIVWDEKSTFSPKDVVIPVTQTLFFFTEEEYREPKASDRKILVFLRPCDINGFRRLDTIYLRNGEDPDFYYRRLRERIKFVMMECRESFDNCFCVSMGSNITEEYSMAVRFGDQSLQLDVPDESLQTFFDPDMAEIDFTPEFVQKNKQVVTPPEVQEMPPEVFDHEMWAQYKKRCIACGRCTTHCVTCSCHTTMDFFYDDNALAGERRRVWASCHVNDFSLMAGGHDFRTDNGARLRFKVLHKVYDFKKRFGEHMCVGCGRCDDNCPEYISFANAVNALSEIV